MGLREFVSDPRFQSKDLLTKRAMLADYGVEEADFGPLLAFSPTRVDVPAKQPDPTLEAQNRFMVSPGPAVDSASRFVKGGLSRLASNLNPVSMLEGVGNVIAHPINTAKNLVDAQSEGFIKAWDLAGDGRPVEALGQAASGALPILGPLARRSGEKAAETGDLAGAFGEGLADAATGKLRAESPRIIKPIKSGLRYATDQAGIAKAVVRK